MISEIIKMEIKEAPRTRKLYENVVLPLALGAGVGFIAQKIGFDMTAMEGMKQSLLTTLGAATLYTSIKNRSEEDSYYANHDNPPIDPKEHPYLTSAISAVVIAGMYCVASAGIEFLTKIPISQKFVSIVGGLEGALGGVIIHSRARKSLPLYRH